MVSGQGQRPQNPTVTDVNNAIGLESDEVATQQAGHFFNPHNGILTTGEHPLDDLPDFSGQEAVVQPDGSVCIFKVKHVEKLEKQHIKECWHQNVESCHETFVTEFKPMQERKCDDNTFWKTCKISFREIALNYTVRTCFQPLVEDCEKNYQGPVKQVCRTWFEAQCNTTYVQSQGQEYHDKHVKDIKASTWCEQVPKKICAPDHCRYVAGPEECRDKTIPSSMVQPEESCDLQPATDCRIVTNLVPHLIRHPICEQVPQEFCHMKLDNPRLVKKPVNMKWCTFLNGTTSETPTEEQIQSSQSAFNPSQFNLELVNGDPTLTGKDV